MKAILAIIVMLHHWKHAYGYAGILSFLEYGGYLAVGAFLFISGYGLMASKSGRATIRNVVYQGLKIIIPYVIISMIFGLSLQLFGEINWSSYLKCLFSFSPMLPNSWYAIAILIFYAFYYISRFVFKENNMRVIISVFLMQCIYICILWKMDIGGTWYRSCLCFTLGMLWYLLKEKVYACVEKYAWIITILSIVCFFGTMAFVIIPIDIAGVNLLACEVSACIFSIIAVIVMRIIPLKSRIWDVIGESSYEVYLLHGIFLYWLAESCPGIVMLVVVFPITILIAIGLHIVLKKYIPIEKIKESKA